MYKIITIGITVIMAGIALTTMNTSTVFATAEPEPDTVGKTNKQTNQENLNDNSEPGASETGRHASNPTESEDGPSTPTTENCDSEQGTNDHGRCGLALNRGKGNTEGSPQETICAVTKDNAPGC